MNSAKKLVLLVLGLVVASLAWGGGASEPAEGETIVIRVAHNLAADPETSMNHAGALAFKESIESATDGRVEVQIFPAGQLGDQRVMFESLQMGTLEMAIIGNAPIVNWYKPFGVIGLPYAFKNSEIAWNVLDGSFGDELSEGLAEATGVRVLAYGENGFRHFTNSVREIRSPADLAGLKIRIQENPAHIRMITAMGGIPTPMAFGEVYTSLQQGVLDGQENPINVILTAKLYEVQDYLALDGHIWAAAMLMTGDDFYNSLPADIQEAVEEASVAFNEGMREVTTRMAQDGIALLEDEGMQVYRPTTEELDAFAGVAQPSVVEFLESEGVGDWIDRLRAEIAKFE
jgi:TRAP-type transport system periplasmic protein